MIKSIIKTFLKQSNTQNSMAIDDLVSRHNSDTWPSQYKWTRLSKMVDEIRAAPGQYGYERYFGEFETTMMPETNWIRLLYLLGWEVELKRLYKGECSGLIIPKKKLIKIDNRMSNYERDVTLMHELVHAWFCKYFNETLPDDEPPEKKVVLTLAEMEQKRNSAVVEYIARRLRAQPPVLHAALKYFDIPVHIYDAPTAKMVGYKWKDDTVQMEE